MILNPLAHPPATAGGTDFTQARSLRYRLKTQQTSGVFVVNLLQDFLRRADAVNAPAALRRNRRGRVIKILVFRFQKPVIDFVQLIAEDLLRRLVAVRRRVRRKQNSVLVLVEELARHARLPAELADARGNVNIHVWITIQTLGNVRQVLRIRGVQRDKFRARMTLNHTIARFLKFGITRKVAAVKGPIRVRAEFLVTFVEAIP